MRFYRVVVRNSDGRILIPNYNGVPGFTPVEYSPELSTYTSLNAGMSVYDTFGSNPAALRLEMDIALTAMDSSLPNSFVKVTGVGLQEIAQAANLNGMYVDIFGGMAAGLPLANPAQAGLIASGQVVQCFGNWTGAIQDISIFIGQKLSSPSSSQTTGHPGVALSPTTYDAPAGIAFQWKPGQPMMEAVVQTLNNAYPSYSIAGAIHDGLVWVGAETTAFFANLQQFAKWLNNTSLAIISGYAPPQTQGAYAGVHMWSEGGTIYLADGTTQTTPRSVMFQELIGQPVWTEAFTVQACCPMRSDIPVGSYVTLPPGTPGVTQQGSGSQYFLPQAGNGGFSNAKSGSIFSGTFRVAEVRHIGDSRDPGHASWITALNLKLAYIKPSTTGASALPVVYTASASNMYGFTGSTS